ncbi:MAG: glycoside hydrolase [Ruminococcus sp.]|nr:glycoside hydrolase [Ruminococcus sp.]
MHLKHGIALVLAGTVCLSGASVSAVYAADADVQKYEFEDGVLNGCNVCTYTSLDEGASGNPVDISGFSGSGYVYIEQKNTSVTVNVEAPAAGLYELKIGYCEASDPNKKVQYLNVNGQNQGEVTFPYYEGWAEITAGYVPLQEGSNSIEIASYWGYTMLDYLTIAPADESISNLTPERTLSDPDAADSAKRLYSYLLDNYGSHIISGQQENCGSHNYNFANDPSTYIKDNEAEFAYIEEHTGKLPAIRGIDMLTYNSSSDYRDDATGRAIEWYQKYKGIVTLSWHWSVPSEEGGTDPQFYVESASANYTTFSISRGLTEGTWEHEVIMKDIEVLAQELLKIQEAGVPVLFRPLHEAEGAWFWWGAEGPEYCVELYRLLYDQLVNVYGLHNLIWEWTSYVTPNSPKWYPGDEYVDIVSYDKYNCSDGESNLSAITGTFYGLVASTEGRKPVAMSENDSIPALDNLMNEKAAWLYFCPWYGWWLTGEQNNPVDNLIEIYQSDYCITLDELPDLTAYPISTESTGSKPSQTTVTTTAAETKPTAAETTVTTAITTTVSAEETTTTAKTTGSTTVTATTTGTADADIITADLYGDVNQDGTVTLLDAVYLNKYLAKVLDLNKYALANAACCNDGVINSADNLALLKYIVRLVEKLPVVPAE